MGWTWDQEVVKTLGGELSGNDLADAEETLRRSAWHVCSDDVPMCFGCDVDAAREALMRHIAAQKAQRELLAHALGELWGALKTGADGSRYAGEVVRSHRENAEKALLAAGRLP